MNDEDSRALRHLIYFEEGRMACVENYIARSRGNGTVVGNPYPESSNDHKAWQKGYAYQDEITKGWESYQDQEDE